MHGFALEIKPLKVKLCRLPWRGPAWHWGLERQAPQDPMKRVSGSPGQRPSARKPSLTKGLCCCRLESLNHFRTRDPTLSFCTEPQSHVAGGSLPSLGAAWPLTLSAAFADATCSSCQKRSSLSHPASAQPLKHHLSLEISRPSCLRRVQKRVAGNHCGLGEKS